jgi:hypothetical protein
MTWKGIGRKRLWHNLRYYSGIHWRERGKNTKALSQDIRCPGEDLNAGPLEFDETSYMDINTWDIYFVKCLLCSVRRE